MQFDDQQTKIIVMLNLGFVVWEKKEKRKEITDTHNELFKFY